MPGFLMHSDHPPLMMISIVFQSEQIGILCSRSITVLHSTFHNGTVSIGQAVERGLVSG